MKKKIVPKKVAGFKVPKSVRKSSLLRNMLASRTGRQMLARALVAGANAAAAVLTDERADVRKPGKISGRRRALAASVAGEAIESATAAAIDVVTSPTRPLFKASAKAKEGRIFPEPVTH
ncbi:hypothetical protein [Neorhizobium galegae]|uniref:hypothetical protein n=1 Tax=Neorhizobium galegae TaxID=399 RepID=UPI002103FF90|nr:hypothetical protein [Neorhizobium galegae]MCQ1852676.1 hypothetical protein [Neorhizobium galegae]